MSSTRCASLESPRYLQHAGRPVLAIWGFGFVDRPASPQQAAKLIEFFKNHPDPRYRVTLFGGIPAGWRTLTRDSQPDPAWAAVYRSFDIISPWTVGRFRDTAGIERFYADSVAADLVETRRLGIDYMPVMFPGFSWHNMNPAAASTRFRGAAAGSSGSRSSERSPRAPPCSTARCSTRWTRAPRCSSSRARRATRQPASGHARRRRRGGSGDWYLRLAREAQWRLRRNR